MHEMSEPPLSVIGTVAASGAEYFDGCAVVMAVISKIPERVLKP